jgi:hypothetical protein
MRLERSTKPLAAATLAALMLAGPAGVAAAQSHDDHSMAVSSNRHRPNAKEGALVKAVREATEQYKDVSALGTDFVLTFGCVSGGDFGAMGLHFVNFPRVFDGEIDVARPEIILYEPLPKGGVRITGADYLVLAEDWDKKNPGAPPQLMGQLFHLFESPNRFGLPPFYTLHVWAWKGNPAGTFSNWNPAVSCDAFNPPTPDLQQ